MDQVAEPEITIEYECSSDRDECVGEEGPDCPACHKITTTRRRLGKCDEYANNPSQWARVHMYQTEEGQNFFYGVAVWEQDPNAPAGELLEVWKMTSQVPPFLEIQACQHGNEVWWYVARIN